MKQVLGQNPLAPSVDRMKHGRKKVKLSKLAISLVSFTLCAQLQAADKGDKNLKGEVKLDGSSTVFPIAEAAAEEFQKLYPNVRVTVGLSGTGGGFKKFVLGEIDIANASRKIKDEESKKAAAGKVDFVELPIANDGISVVVNPANNWAKQMTLAQLKEIWQPGSKVKTWKDINPAWPDSTIKLFGPGADSGTFDFFTEHVMGTARLSRNDYVASEDDNVLVTGVSKDKNALAYFGYAYYHENKQSMRSLEIAKDKEYVAPTDESIESGKYTLARPLLIYVNTKSIAKPEVKAFVEFMLKNGKKLSKEVGYVPLKDNVYAEALKKLEGAATQAAKASH